MRSRLFKINITIHKIHTIVVSNSKNSLSKCNTLINFLQECFSKSKGKSIFFLSRLFLMGQKDEIKFKCWARNSQRFWWPPWIWLHRGRCTTQHRPKRPPRPPPANFGRCVLRGLRRRRRPFSWPHPAALSASRFLGWAPAAFAPEAAPASSARSRRRRPLVPPSSSPTQPASCSGSSVGGSAIYKSQA